MNKIAIALACLTYAGHGRRVREPVVESQKPLTALASLLKAASPADAFQPSALAARQPNRHRSVALAAPRLAAIARMQDKDKTMDAEETELPFESGENQLVQTLGFVYSIPALVGGLALKYAELPPVNLDSTPEAEKLREEKGSKIQKKIVKDMTRYTYGDAHMEDPLRFLKLAPAGMGVPVLCNLREEVTKDGQYSLSMRFTSVDTPFRVWKDRGPRYARFFGPGVRAQLKVFSKKKKQVELTLITANEGDDFTPLEETSDGTLIPVITTAEKNKMEEEARAQAIAKGVPAEEPRGAV